MFLADDDTLEAWVNLGDRVVAVTAEFPTTVAPATEPRAADVEMVRAIVDGIAKARSSPDDGFMIAVCGSTAAAARLRHRTR
jgi:hypothetical protein